MPETKTVADLWEDILGVLQSQMNQESFELWFRPLKAGGFEGEQFVIKVPNKFFLDWIRDHYQPTIQKILQEKTGDNVAIRYEISADLEKLIPKAPSEAASRPPAVVPPHRLENTVFNPKYTFDTFVVGPSNRFAQAATLAVAKDPGNAYNPLFIYGGVGLGKTHLMHAAGHYLQKVHPGMHALYISSEKFINEFIDSLRYERMNDFRRKYRSLDCLMIDDIQFFVNKQSSQEEFFYTFNTLFDSRKQIIISSDRPPKEIPSLQERLITRFEWGVVVDIQPPDLETRTAILRRKSEAERLFVPDDVILFLASQIRTNIRELEGSLIRVVAHSSLTGTPLTVDSARETLRDLLAKEEASRPVSIDLIQEVIASHYHLSSQDMKSKRRTDAIAFPRQIAMYIARTLTDLSTTVIGEAFGGKDHTTVMHACHKVKSKLDSDPFFAAHINKVIQQIRSEPNRT